MRVMMLPEHVRTGKRLLQRVSCSRHVKRNVPVSEDVTTAWNIPRPVFPPSHVNLLKLPALVAKTRWSVTSTPIF